MRCRSGALDYNDGTPGWHAYRNGDVVICRPTTLR